MFFLNIFREMIARFKIVIVTEVDLLSYLFTGEKTGVLHAGVGGASAPIPGLPLKLPGANDQPFNEQQRDFIRFFLEAMKRDRDPLFDYLFQTAARHWTPLPTHMERVPTVSDLINNPQHLEEFMITLAEGAQGLDETDEDSGELN